MSDQRTLYFLALCLFVASGFTGLIYQSIWTQYLGLLLGHAAYAQALVLAVFMGGMALGSWFASRWSARSQRLLVVYAALEAAIGLAGVLFHPVFDAYQSFALGTMMPGIDSPTIATTAKWMGAALLVLPQCVLLGATFPIMSAALLRRTAGSDASILGGLYFSNSIGAVLGALGSTFALIPLLALPGTIFVAGVLNLGIAFAALLLSKSKAPGGVSSIPDATTSRTSQVNPRPIRGTRMFLALAALITGLTSFVYEIAWVRMLNQVFGSSVHAFEIMLATFILGLALGGRYVQKRGANYDSPLVAASTAQILMGVFAILSLIGFAQSFPMMSWVMHALSRTDGGYVLLVGFNALIAVVVMLPAAFFAGMTLPLFTMGLLRRGGGEPSIGQIYASNTLGAIVGVALTIHLLIPLLGLRGAIVIAGLADLALGIALLVCYAPRLPKARLAVSFAITAGALGLVSIFGDVSRSALASGVFRHGSLQSGEKSVPSLVDGKTATIAILDFGEYLAISTNGKPDASLSLSLDQPPTPDEITMIMAGVMPLLHHADPRRVGIIGWGSGLTTQTVLGSAAPDLVETIEIERAMHEGAKAFGSRVARAYQDPRSVLRIDDARSVFAASRGNYDVVISEPSNPWVSGVSSLFTREFYRLVKNHLNDDGILIQWLQTYELNDPLLARMVAALLSEFPHVEAYYAFDTDMILVASSTPLTSPDWNRIRGGHLEQELHRVGLRSLTDIEDRRIAGRGALQAFVASNRTPPLSDYDPVVALQAPRARFKDQTANQIRNFTLMGLPILEMLDPPAWRSSTDQADNVARQEVLPAITRAKAYLKAMSEPDILNLKNAESAPTKLRILSASVVETSDQQAWCDSAVGVAAVTMPYLSSQELSSIWSATPWLAHADQQPASVRRMLSVFDAIARRDGKTMAEAAHTALGAAENSERPWPCHSYVALSAMLGELASGNPAAAVSTFDRYQSVLYSHQAGRQLAPMLRAWALLESRDAGQR